MQINKKIVAGTIVSLVIVGGVAAAFLRPQKDPLAGAVFVNASVGDLKEMVSVTGNVKPASEVQLAFENSGRVAAVYTRVGAHVTAGTLLAAIGASDLSSDLKKAQAVVASAKAQLKQVEAALQTQQVKLTELQKGARPEEIAVKEIELVSAQTTFAQLNERTPTDTLLSIYTDSQDAVNRLTDHFFENDTTENPRLLFTSTQSAIANNLPSERFKIRNALLQFSSDIQNTFVDSEQTLLSLAKARVHLLLINEYLTHLVMAWDGVLNWSSGTTVSSTEIATEKSNLSSAQTTIQSGLDALSTRAQAIESQQLVIDRITQELALKKAPATQEQLDAQMSLIKQAEANVSVQQANILQAEANLAGIQSQFAKRTIRAPFSGTITKQDVKVGEIVSMNTELIGMISDAGYQVEANIPEADIANLVEYQSASVILDAYPGVIFMARVRSIDPAATMIEGVATYRTIFEFIEVDERLKSGLSADVDIVTAEKTHILTIPQRAIISREGKTFVRVEENGMLVEREVGIGIRADGMTEILWGLQTGERVLVREVNTL